MMRRPLSFVAFILAAVPNFALAWGGEGHEIVCAIAWDEMTAGARNKVQAIMHISTREEFAESCTWADEYRFSHHETSGWHFVNVPPGATSVNLKRDCSGLESCAVGAITDQLALLKDPATPPEDRAKALKFVAHLVGDVHQPLHVSYAEDRGGNDIKGRFMKRKTNLHALWDRGLIETDKRDGYEIADALREEITAKQRAMWTVSGPLKWADESLAVTLKPATGYVDHGDFFQLGEAYRRKELPEIWERLKQAGVRLGFLLTGALG